MSGDDQVSGVEGSSGLSKLQAQQMEKKERAAKLDARLESLNEDIQQELSGGDFSYFAIQQKFKTSDERFSKTAKEEAQEAKGKDESLKNTATIEQITKTYASKNPELAVRALMALRNLVKSDDNADTILAKVRQSYPDHFLSDEALDYLIETTAKGSEHAQQLQEAKAKFNDAFAREIKAGRNIATQARDFSSQGLGSPTGLRDLYRDLTGNPKPALTTFNELLKTFDYAKMRQALEFVLHSLGADMKSKGPSIARAELQNLFSSARTMQAILGVYRFFQARQLTMMNAFNREGLMMPTRLTFILLAELFVKLIGERYPSTDKILRLAQQLGLSEEYAAQIIVFMQYRDATRNISPRLFKSDRHRQDVLASLLDALSELEDLLDEEDEEDEEEDEDEEQ